MMSSEYRGAIDVDSRFPIVKGLRKAVVLGSSLVVTLFVGGLIVSGLMSHVSFLRATAPRFGLPSTVAAVVQLKGYKHIHAAKVRGSEGAGSS
jgi:hypothetical protein